MSLIFHPGSHVGQGVEVGITYISNMLNSILTPTQTTTVLLETMAGKGSEIGRSFEELREIMDRVHLKDKLGICLDTCHVWDGGYDIVNDLDGVLHQFDSIIGLSNLKAIHLNDSMNPLGAHKDRHAKIGEGMIGLDAIIRIINHPAILKDSILLNHIQLEISHNRSFSYKICNCQGTIKNCILYSINTSFISFRIFINLSSSYTLYFLDTLQRLCDNICNNT